MIFDSTRLKAQSRYLRFISFGAVLLSANSNSGIRVTSASLLSPCPLYRSLIFRLLTSYPVLGGFSQHQVVCSSRPGEDFR
jgi:hypothetical protein